MTTDELQSQAFYWVNRFGYQVDADFTILKLLVDGFYSEQQSIKQALDELEREDRKQ